MCERTYQSTARKLVYNPRSARLDRPYVKHSSTEVRGGEINLSAAVCKVLGKKRDRLTAGRVIAVCMALSRACMPLSRWALFIFRRRFSGASDAIGANFLPTFDRQCTQENEKKNCFPFSPRDRRACRSTPSSRCLLFGRTFFSRVFAARAPPVVNLCAAQMKDWQSGEQKEKSWE